MYTKTKLLTDYLLIDQMKIPQKTGSIDLCNFFHRIYTYLYVMIKGFFFFRFRVFVFNQNNTYDFVAHSMKYDWLLYFKN